MVATEARVPFDVPRGDDLAARLPSVLEVIYLIFNEGYADAGQFDYAGRASRGSSVALGTICSSKRMIRVLSTSTGWRTSTGRARRRGGSSPTTWAARAERPTS
jgi:hypothetical protein